MAKTGLTVDMKIDGLRETLAAFRRLPKDASKEMRERSLELSQLLAARAQSAARADLSPQSKLVAPTVKARKDRVPVIQAGGSKRVGRNNAPVFKVLFGSEFGSNRYSQFGRPHQGRKGAWFFDTVERDQAEISKAWNHAADEVIKKFTAHDVGGA